MPWRMNSPGEGLAYSEKLAAGVIALIWPSRRNRVESTCWVSSAMVRLIVPQRLATAIVFVGRSWKDGLRLVRVWSADWVRDRDKQVKRILAMLEEAKTGKPVAAENEAEVKTAPTEEEACCQIAGIRRDRYGSGCGHYRCNRSNTAHIRLHAGGRADRRGSQEARLQANRP